MPRSPLLDVVPAGVLTGDQAKVLFDYAKKNNFALLAVNCTSTSTATAALEAARDIGAPIIIQVDDEGVVNWAGNGLDNSKLEASIAGSIAAAHLIRSIAPHYNIPVVMHSDHCSRELLPWLEGMLAADEAYYKQHQVPLFTSHMLDLSEETKEDNIKICVEYFTRMSKINLWLEMEIGMTGGEKDGVGNKSAENASLFTKPNDIYDVYTALSAVSPNFSIAAAFGNVHGVYKAGNVRLRPELLAEHQAYTISKTGDQSNPKPLYLVFHGGSGSRKDEIKTAVSHGVIKMNMNTDTQYAYMAGVRDFMLTKIDYLKTQVGNPDGADLPNKKYYHPLTWVREGEKRMRDRVVEACTDLGFVPVKN